VLNKCQLRISKSLQQLEFLSSRPPPSFYKTVIPFIQSFNPAKVARPFLPKLSLLPEDPSVSFDFQALARRMDSFIARVFPILAYNVKLAEDAPLIVDTGASVCITPSLADFKHGLYRTSQLCVKDLSGENPVAGEGIIQWKVEDESGVTRLIEVPGVHIVSSPVRLLSPQVLLATSKDCSISMPDQSKILLHMPSCTAVCALIGSSSCLQLQP
jgi:hypothetical protein